MYKCLHCGKPGISTIRKLFLGPAVPATCKNCGKKVGVTYRSISLGLLPFLVPVLVFYLSGAMVLVLASFLLWCYVHLKWVPLIRK